MHYGNMIQKSSQWKQKLSALLQDNVGSNAHAHVFVTLLVASYSQMLYIFLRKKIAQVGSYICLFVL